MGSRGAGSGRKDAALIKATGSSGYKATRIQSIKVGDEIAGTFDTEGNRTNAKWLYTNINTRGEANAPVIVTSVKVTGKQVKIEGKIDRANFQDRKTAKWGVDFTPVSKTFKTDEIVTTRKKKK